MASEEFTIADVGWALPHMVHDGKRVPAFDEDETTLAVAALRDLGIEPDGLDDGVALVLLGEADADTVAAAVGHAGDVGRAADLRDALADAGPGGVVCEAYSPRMGPAWGAAVRVAGPGEGDPVPAKLRELLPEADGGGAVGAEGGAPATVEVDLATATRHVEAFETTPEERTPMGAYVSPQTYREDVDARYRLVGRRCPDGHVSFPPPPRCPVCGSTELTAEPLSGLGEVHTVTVVGQGAAPAEFTSQNQALGAYAVAIVELSEGPRIVAQLTDCDPHGVRIGDAVEAVFRRIYVQRDGVRYGTKFRPAPA